jgi:uncharacterized protein (DUF302 family)
MLTSVSSYERLPVNAPAQTVVAALRDTLGSLGFTEYAVVDHGRDMAAAGAPGFLAWTVVFGNPAGGAKLLARDLAAAVDIPLRLAVIAADAGRSEIILREMSTLLDEDLRPLADAFTGALRTVAGQARDRAEATTG